MRLLRVRAGDGLSAVEVSRVPRCLGARGEAFQLLVQGLEYCVAKRTSEALLLGHKNKNIL
jgi:hypothetical protein